MSINSILNFFKKLTIQQFALCITFIIMVGLYVISAWSFYTISYTEPRECIFFPNRIQYETFFDIFEIPIKLAAYGSGALAAWLTLMRISQTERQLVVTTDHYRLTNYYKHIEQYSILLEKDTLMKMLFIASKKKNNQHGRQGNEENDDIGVTDPRMILLSLYRQYYYSDYYDFNASLNTEWRTKILSYQRDIYTSPLNQQGTHFLDLTIQQLEQYSAHIDDAISDIIVTVIEESVQIITAFLKMQHLDDNVISIEVDKFKRISILYFKYSFYSSLLMFDGIRPHSAEQFSINYSNYLPSLGIR